MEQRVSLKQLKTSYFVSVAVILLLLLTTQLIIQLTLHQEVSVRAQSTQLLTQALRVQRIQRNALYFLEAPGDGGTISQMQMDITSIDQMEAAFLNGGLSGDELANIKATDDDEKKMIGAADTILLINEEKPYPKNDGSKMKLISNAEVQVFSEQPIYLRGLVSANTLLESQTDSLILRIQLVEISLFSLSVLTLLSEYIFVARPGMKSVEEAVSVLQEAVIKVESASRKKKEKERELP